MTTKENEVKFEQIITQAWNDYKGAVTAFAVLKKRFEEDMSSVSSEAQKTSLTQMYEMENTSNTRKINNHFNYFQRVYQANSQFVSTDFCAKIDREIADIQQLLEKE